MAKKDKNKNNNQWTNEDIDNSVYSKKKPLSIKKQKEIYIDEPRIKSAETFDKAAQIAFDIARLHPTYGIGMNLIDATNDLKNKDFNNYMSNVTGGIAKATYNASKYTPVSTFNYKKLRNKLGNSILGSIGILMGAQDYISDAKQLYDDVSSIKFKNGGVIRLRQNKLACGGKRPKAFLGAIIGAVGSIAGGIINSISARKQRKQQEKLQEQQKQLEEDAALTNQYANNAEIVNEIQRQTRMEYKSGGDKTGIKPVITKGGTAIPLNKNLSLLRGRSHNTGGIIIGTGKNSIEAEGNEVVQNTGDELRIFSAQPMLNGYSPAELVIKGYNPNKVFNAQEKFKDMNRLNDDGSKKKCGGKRKLAAGGRQSLKTAIGREQFEQFKRGVQQMKVGALNNIPTSTSTYVPNLSINDNLSLKGVDIPSKTKNNNKTFSQAFAEARKAGKKEFTWKGKRYGTLYKDEVKNTSTTPTNKTTTPTNKTTTVDKNKTTVDKNKTTSTLPSNMKISATYDYAGDIITPSLLSKRKNIMSAASEYIARNPKKTSNSSNKQVSSKNNIIVNQNTKTQNLPQKQTNSKTKKLQSNADEINVTTKFSELPNGGVAATVNGTNYYFPTEEDRNKFLKKVENNKTLDINNIWYNKLANNIKEFSNSPLGQFVEGLMYGVTGFSRMRSPRMITGRTSPMKQLEAPRKQLENKKIDINEVVKKGMNEKQLGKQTSNNNTITIKNKKSNRNEKGTTTYDAFTDFTKKRNRREYKSIDLYKCGGKTKKAALGLSINTDDWISAGIGALGSIGSSIAGLVATNKMKAPEKPTQYQAAKLKTNYNISPQLSEINRSRERQLDDVSSNTASSVARLARRNRINVDSSDAINQLYGQKENIETQLINQDRLNAQQVRNRNTEQYNQYLKELNQFNNEKTIARTNAINNMISGITGAASDLITTGQQRYQDEQTISAITGSNERNNIKYLMDAGYKPSKTQLEAALASSTTDEEIEFYTKALNELYPKRRRLRRTTPISENNYGIDLNDTSNWMAN